MLNVLAAGITLLTQLSLSSVFMKCMFVRPQQIPLSGMQGQRIIPEAHGKSKQTKWEASKREGSYDF